MGMFDEDVSRYDDDFLEEFSFAEEFESETSAPSDYVNDYDDPEKFMELKDKIRIYLEIAALTELIEEDLWDNFTEVENFLLTQDKGEELDEADEDSVLNTLTEFLLPFYSGE